MKVKIPNAKINKLGHKTFDGIFIDYAHHSHAYRFSVWKFEFSDIVVNTIKESDDAIFFEDIFRSKNIIVPLDTLSISSQDIKRKWKAFIVEIRKSVR